MTRKKTRSYGAFRKEKNGTWSIDTKVKVFDKFKTLKRRGYKTLHDAKMDFERAKAEFLATHGIYYADMSLNELVNEYIYMRAKTVSETTIYVEHSRLNKHFIEKFDKQPLRKVFTKDNMREWHKSFTELESLVATSKNAIIKSVKSLLKFAYDHKYIEANTFQDCDVLLYDVKTPQVKNDKTIWSLEQIKQFFEAIPKDSNDYVMFTLAFDIGARINEFLALQVKDFDYKSKTISINSQIIKVGTNNRKLVNELKTTASHRDVIIMPESAELLSDYIKARDLQANDFLFPGQKRKYPLTLHGFRRKLNKYSEAANLPLITSHTIRHMRAMMLASVCETSQDIVAASRRMGHSPTMFMNTYANHLRENTEQDLMQKLAKKF